MHRHMDTCNTHNCAYTHGNTYTHIYSTLTLTCKKEEEEGMEGGREDRHQLVGKGGRAHWNTDQPWGPRHNLLSKAG